MFGAACTVGGGATAPPGPTLTLPASMTVSATGPSGATVSWSVSATSAVDGPVPVTCNPASGSLFPFGVTAVTCSANDSAGHTSFGGFQVQVLILDPNLIIANMSIGGRNVMVSHREPETTGRSAVVLLQGFRSTGALLYGTLNSNNAILDHDLVVYVPQAIDNQWNAGLCCGGATTDDVGYLSTLVDAIRATPGISKVLLYGVSNGGMLARRYIATAGVAAVDGVILDSATSIEHYVPITPLPVLTVHDIGDLSVPYDGGSGISNSMSFGPFPPAFDQANQLAIDSGCTGGGETPTIGGTQATWTCPSGMIQRLYSVNFGGHTAHGVIDGRTSWQVAIADIGL